MTTAIIFGFSGQDGAILSNLLLKKNINLVGVTRNKNQNFINHLKLKTLQSIKIVEINYYNYNEIYNLIREIRPKFIFNFSGESSVSRSYVNYPIRTL